MLAGLPDALRLLERRLHGRQFRFLIVQQCLDGDDLAAREAVTLPHRVVLTAQRIMARMIMAMMTISDQIITLFTQPPFALPGVWIDSGISLLCVGVEVLT